MGGAEVVIVLALAGLAGFLIYQGIAHRERSVDDFSADDTSSLDEFIEWALEFRDAARHRISNGRWLDSEFRSYWQSRQPQDPRTLIPQKTFKRLISGKGTAVWQQASELFDQGFEEYCLAENNLLWNLEIENSQALFDDLETQPLTREQREAATVFENRVQIVAAAGSGKTSVMVAKAAYSISRKLADPERILMLAFNRDAADELKNRTRAALKKVGISGSKKVDVDTFHAFGLRVIGEGTGHKPRLAPWAENATVMMNKAQMIIAKLRKTDPQFATDWYLLKTVYFRDLGEFGNNSEIEDRDPETKQRGKRTLAGEIVRSEEERRIANWLYVHDINYVYESRYKYATSDSSHSQYFPDFYYPDIDVYHEHFAIDRNGEPPEHFLNYEDGIVWKRECHRRFGTQLFETTSAEIRSKKDFLRLEKMLRDCGLKPTLNLNKKPKGFEPISDGEIINLILTVMSHFKSNRLTIEKLRSRVKKLESFEGEVRRSLFYRVFERFILDWQEELRVHNYVDFHDMLVTAADTVLAHPETARYDVILVDEFQDTSVARLGLVRALSSRQGVQVTVVGDDWQSINRFAGADLSVMTGFEAAFPGSLTLALTRTFRCDQDICDVSSLMVMRNPDQQRKQVVGQTRGLAPHIRIHFIDEIAESGGPVTARRNEIREIIREVVAHRREEPTKVFILARYNFELEGLKEVNFGPNVDVKTMTIHASKGLEADVVIVVGFNSSTNYGFPSKKLDDPLLSLVMPQPELFPHAEERRLLYVALTRAKEGVFLLSAKNTPSEFVRELRLDYPDQVACFGLSQSDGDFCPECGGALVRRANKKTGSEFIGCQTYPRCVYTRPLMENRR